MTDDNALIYDACRFDKKSQAEAAITGMNGVVPEGGTEPLVVKVAEEHGKMKAAYYAGYHAGINNLRGGGAGKSYGNAELNWSKIGMQNLN